VLSKGGSFRGPAFSCELQPHLAPARRGVSPPPAQGWPSPPPSPSWAASSLPSPDFQQRLDERIAEDLDIAHVGAHALEVAYEEEEYLAGLGVDPRPWCR
jgi:hypothetical protein